MKRIITFLIVAAMCFALAACSNHEAQDIDKELHIRIMNQVESVYGLGLTYYFNDVPVLSTGMKHADGSKITIIPDFLFFLPSCILEYISQSTCLRYFVSVPTSTIVTVDSLRYSSLMISLTFWSSQSSGISPNATEKSLNTWLRSAQEISSSLYAWSFLWW